jgi:hypothetical protein
MNMEQPQSCWQQNSNLVGTLEKALSWLRSRAEDVKANAREFFLIRGTNQFLRLHDELWDSVASISRTWWRGNRLDTYSNEIFEDCERSWVFRLVKQRNGEHAGLLWRKEGKHRRESERLSARDYAVARELPATSENARRPVKPCIEAEPAAAEGRHLQ